MTSAASLSPSAQREVLSGSEAVTSAHSTQPPARRPSLNSLVLIAPRASATGGFYLAGRLIDARQRACAECGEPCWAPLSLDARAEALCTVCVPARAEALLRHHITTEEVLFPHDGYHI